MYTKKIIIIGGGFAGIHLLKELMHHPHFHITLVDKNNYNFFPPLLYQIATGFLEVSSISFPFRRFLQGKSNVHFRLGTLKAIVPDEKKIQLSDGELGYDYLVIAIGTETNFFGKESIRKNALPMKTVNDAIHIRNHLLQQAEDASVAAGAAESRKKSVLAIAGGGPTSVEIAGMIAEMTSGILKKDYPELENHSIQIYLIAANHVLLAPMSEQAQNYAYQQLLKMGVKVKLDRRVKDYEDGVLYFDNHESLKVDTLIWAAGVTGRYIPGIDPESYGNGKRLLVNQHHEIKNHPGIFAIGDIALHAGDAQFPSGHPQVAQVAIQQSRNLAMNFIKMQNGQPPASFAYRDKGAMAIIGKNRAVADLPKTGWHLKGFFAWVIWLFVHLFSLTHHRNRTKTFYNWMAGYFTKDQSLRLIIKPDAQP